MRAWGRALAVLVTAVTVTGGTTTASAEDTDRLTGADAAHAEAGEVSAATVVALPDLAITHRLPSGAMNLWRMPLSDLEAGYGQPRLVKNLDYGGFSDDGSRTITGDFGDITASRPAQRRDPGLGARQLLRRLRRGAVLPAARRLAGPAHRWLVLRRVAAAPRRHQRRRQGRPGERAQPGGDPGILIWRHLSTGSGLAAPQIVADLRAGGWSYAYSREGVAETYGVY